jgi:hypothetical protein
LGGTVILSLKRVRRWRQQCHRLVISMDTVMRVYIHDVTGAWAW